MRESEKIAMEKARIEKARLAADIRLVQLAVKSGIRDPWEAFHNRDVALDTIIKGRGKNWHKGVLSPSGKVVKKH